MVIKPKYFYMVPMVTDLNDDIKRLSSLANYVIWCTPLILTKIISRDLEIKPRPAPGTAKPSGQASQWAVLLNLHWNCWYCWSCWEIPTNQNNHLSMYKWHNFSPTNTVTQLRHTSASISLITQITNNNIYPAQTNLSYYQIKFNNQQLNNTVQTRQKQ